MDLSAKFGTFNSTIHNMGNLELHFSNKPLDLEFIKINQRKRKIDAGLSLLKYTDKETNQVIIYIPSLELTGYGETLEKAKEMIIFSVDDLMKYWIDLPTEQLKMELSKAGWKQDRFLNKKFSKAFVDANGELQNFAVDNKVERLALTV